MRAVLSYNKTGWEDSPFRIGRVVSVPAQDLPRGIAGTRAEPFLISTRRERDVQADLPPREL